MVQLWGTNIERRLFVCLFDFGFGATHSNAKRLQQVLHSRIAIASAEGTYGMQGIEP